MSDPIGKGLRRKIGRQPHPFSEPVKYLNTLLMSFEQLTPSIHLSAYDESVRKSRHTETVSLHAGDYHLAPRFAEADWRIHTLVTDSQSDQNALQTLDFFLTVTAEKGRASQVAFGLELHCANWTRENFLVLPGAVYDGNRFLCREKAGYPPIVAQTGDIGLDAPTLIGDIPRLSVTANQSRIQLLSADMATPAIGYYDPSNQRGLWVLTPQATRLGQVGFDFEEDLAVATGVIRITAPGIREGTRYHCFQTDRPSPDRAPDWSENEAASLHVRVVTFPCADRATFLMRFNALRAALVAPAAPRERFALSSARALIEEKYNRDNWHEKFGIYATDTARGRPLPDWQSGWIGGGMATYPLLVAGGAETRERSLRSLDWICTEAVTPSGFFKSILKEGQWADDSFGHSKDRRWHMTRKSADLLLFLLKQIDWASRAEAGCVTTPPAWISAARGCAEAFARLWEAEQQIGQFVDEDTGELIVGGSDSAAILPAALTLAARVLKHPAYDPLAEAIANDFWEKFSRQGYTTGGPGEILSAPDSESAFGLLESCVARWEATGAAGWLERAEAAAAYCATWCVSYDYVFPVNSTFGAMQMSSTGTVIANAQNKHSSPGICTLSGDSLFRLYRATGNAFYLGLLREIATSLPQYVSRKDRPILARYGRGPTPPGWICERVNLSDWLEPVGEIFAGACWCEVSLLLTALELPTLYYRPDTGLLVALDLIDARLIERTNSTSIIEIHNSTAHTVQVRIFIESTAEAAKPLSLHTCPQLPSLTLVAGQTISYNINKP